MKRERHKLTFKDFIYAKYNPYSLFYQYLELINKSKISYEYNLIEKKLLDQKKIPWDYLHKCNKNNKKENYMEIFFNQLTLNKIYTGYLTVKSNSFRDEDIFDGTDLNDLSKITQNNIINKFNIGFFKILKYVTEIFNIIKRIFIIRQDSKLMEI